MKSRSVSPTHHCIVRHIWAHSHCILMNKCKLNETACDNGAGHIIEFGLHNAMVRNKGDVPGDVHHYGPDVSDLISVSGPVPHDELTRRIGTYVFVYMCVS